MNAPVSNKTFAGTVCGTLFAVMVSIDPEDLVKTAVMAATGALVSFCTSVLLKWLKKKME